MSPGTTTDSRTVLTELTSLAGARGWTSVTDFTTSFAVDDDRRVAVLTGERAAANAFRRQLDALDDAPGLTSGPLTADGDRTGTGVLGPRRVLVVLRCATPIAPPDLATLRLLRARPAGSYMIVFVGAEVAGTADELDLIERGIRRSVPALPSDAMYGPLADRGIALWAEGDPPAPVAERLAVDRERVCAWLRAAPAGDPDELARVRVRHALDLAEQALASTAVPADTRPAVAGRDDDGARLRRLRSRLVTMHAAVLQRLDGEVALLRSDIEAAFTSVRAEITDAAAELVRTGKVDHTATGRDRLDQHVLARLRRWADQQEPQLRTQATKAVADGVARLLDHDALDWEIANRLTPSPSGSYPHHLIAAVDGLAAGTAAPVAAPSTPGLVAAPNTHRRNVLTAGGAVGGSLMTGILNVAVLPAMVVGGATGFLAAKVLDRLEEPDLQRELTEAVVAHARRIVNSSAFEFDRALNALTQEVQEELHRRLEALETALERAAERCPPADDRAGPSADGDLRALVALRQRLDPHDRA